MLIILCFHLPVERNDGDVVVPSGGRVLGVFSVLDDDVEPGNGRNIFVVIIPCLRMCPLSGQGSNSVIVVRDGWVDRRVLLP